MLMIALCALCLAVQAAMNGRFLRQQPEAVVNYRESMMCCTTRDYIPHRERQATKKRVPNSGYLPFLEQQLLYNAATGRSASSTTPLKRLRACANTTVRLNHFQQVTSASQPLPFAVATGFASAYSASSEYQHGPPNGSLSAKSA